MTVAIRQGVLLSRRGLLAADSIFELAVGLALLVPGSAPATWLTLSPRAAAFAGVLFLVAAAAIGAKVRSGRPDAFIRVLAIGNLVGGAISWIVLLALWSRFPTLGRASLGAIADV